eukprot:gene6324-7485_t
MDADRTNSASDDMNIIQEKFASIKGDDNSFTSLSALSSPQISIPENAIDCAATPERSISLPNEVDAMLSALQIILTCCGSLESVRLVENISEAVSIVLEDCLLEVDVGSQITIFDSKSETTTYVEVISSDQQAPLLSLVPPHDHIRFANDYKNKGVVLFKLKEPYFAGRCFGKCIRHLTLAQTLCQHSPRSAYANLAACHLHLGKPFVNPDIPLRRFFFHDMASYCCDKVLETDSTHIKALYRKAIAQQTNHNPETSIILLKRILQINPENISAQKALKSASADVAKARQLEADKYSKLF